jgi:phage baseplate assembly protein W
MPQTVSRTTNYRDLDLDFLAHPTTKDVSKKVGEDAIKRSIRNLVLSNFYEKPFRPFIGSNAQKLLFENINSLTANNLKNAIEEVITNYEPRVRLNEIQVSVDADNNGYKVYLSYIILNTTTPAIFAFFLERIR